MSKFAKLFDVGDTQVLFYTEYDEDTDLTVIHQITSVDGIRGDLQIKLSGEDQEENADRYLAGIQQETADKVHAHLASLILD